MTVAEYKREWFDARRAELHARGLKDAAIAQQMGFKAPYFSQVVKADTIGDNFIDRMCSAFGFKFVAPGGVAQSSNAETPDREALLQRILKAQEEQATLLKTLAELVIARGKAGV